MNISLSKLYNLLLCTASLSDTAPYSVLYLEFPASNTTIDECERLEGHNDVECNFIVEVKDIDCDVVPAITSATPYVDVIIANNDCTLAIH